MRHRWMCLPMIGLLCLLGGCGGGGEPSADELALQIRGEYLSMEGFTARVELEADYGERVYAYAMDTSYAREEGLTLTLTAPEEVAGITAHVQEGETFLEYDGVRVETGPLNEAGLSPMDALPALLAAVQEGYLAECSFLTVGETETLHLTARDPEGEPGVGTEVQLWLDPGSSTSGVISFEVVDFEQDFTVALSGNSAANSDYDRYVFDLKPDTGPESQPFSLS